MQSRGADDRFASSAGPREGGRPTENDGLPHIGIRGEFFAASPAKGFGGDGSVFALAFSAYMLIMAFGRLQVTENGIWQYWWLLPWRKIAAYRWADDNTLLVTSKARLLFLRGALPVPSARQRAVDNILLQFCPVEAGTTLPRPGPATL
jgi:hypothetical protein